MNRKDLFACPFYFDKIALDDKQVMNAIDNNTFLGAMSLNENVLETDFKFLFDPIDKIVSEIMSQMEFKEYKIFTSWISKTVKGYRHGQDHMHSNSFFSGILYLTENASPIVFRHPLPWRWNTSKYDVTDGMLKSNAFVFEPKKGDIVLFPSHVFHMILPHKHPTCRYSIAFNVHPTEQYGTRDSTINVSIRPNK